MITLCLIGSLEQNTNQVDSFFFLKMGYHPNFSWRSICQAKWILDKGCRWRIGNGSRVHIWGDNWLPEQYAFKVWSPPQYLDSDTIVQSLINPDTLSWNHSFIDIIFMPFEREHIKAIPWSFSSPSDRVIWHHSKDGQYEVKSGCHLSFSFV